MRRRMLWIGVAAVVVALSAATVAFAATQRSTAGSAPTRAATSTLGSFRGTMMGGTFTVKDMRALHAEHLADMKAWFDKYGADPSTAAARAAMAKLRAEHWNDMRALMKKYGVNLGTTGRGTTMGGAGGGMMGGYGPSTGSGMMGSI